MELITQQCWYLISALCAGMLILFLYDGIRVFRLRKKRPVLRCLLVDWLFFLTTAVLTFYVVFPLNDGTLRSYFIVAFIVSAYSYHKWVSPWVIKVYQWLFDRVFGFAEKCVKNVANRKKKLEMRKRSLYNGVISDYRDRKYSCRIMSKG